MKNITVLGCGVIGLSTAIRLKEEGYSVRIVADRSTPRTTSDVAAAFWYPYHVDGKREKIKQWASDSFKTFHALLNYKPAGITEIRGKEFFETDDQLKEWIDEMWWAKELSEINFGHLDKAEVPEDFVSGVCFTVPVIHMPSYMGYLMHRFNPNGDDKLVVNRRVSHHKKNTTDEILAFDPNIFDEADLIVNCTGLGAHGLFNDKQLYALKGQVVSIAMNGFSDLVFITKGEKYRDDPLYIVPRGEHDIILGGTAYKAPIPSDAEPFPVVEEAITTKIISACARLFPAFDPTRIRILKPNAGFRPCRHKTIRLEPDNHFEKPLIHNYGHGGGGVTLSWGCAEEVIRLVKEKLE